MGIPIPPQSRHRVDRFKRIRIPKDWGGDHLFRGRPPGPDAVIVDNNDYLHLARDRRIIEAMTARLDAAGTSTLMSGILLFGDHPQLSLERELAAHMGAPAGILCQSGWAANTGLLQAIADPSTPVYIDVIAHMSLWEGAHAARAKTRLFRHNDLAHLRRRIADHGPGVIAVDGVYSSDGSLAPLAQLADIATESDCVLVVDESHSLGVHGERGEGIVAALGLQDAVHFRTVSLSKAFAGRAGLITCCTPDFVDYFKHESYPAVFSTTLLPHDLAGLEAALHAVREDGWRRERLHQITEWVREELTDAGIDLHGSQTQILPLEAGTELRAIRLRDAMMSQGVFPSPFGPPATSRRRATMRVSLHAGLTDAQVERLIEVCLDVRPLLSGRSAEAPDQARSVMDR
nr:alpha-hydroxyketone-type quorum-sensing autoinducer synthase [Streptomyces coryli]